MSKARLLIDTNILIDYLRGKPASVQFLESASQDLLISVINVAELFAGVREGKEKHELVSFLEIFSIIPVSQWIAQRGGLYRRQFGKSHHVGLADALIAATAEEQEALLVSYNQKHFPMLEEILVPPNLH